MPPPAQNRFRPYMAVSQPFWIGRPWQKVIYRFLFWSVNPQNLKSISPSSTQLWAKIAFDYIWWSVSHLESDDLVKKSTQLFILRHQRTDFEVNISIQYQFMAQSRFWKRRLFSGWARVSQLCCGLVVLSSLKWLSLIGLLEVGWLRCHWTF